MAPAWEAHLESWAGEADRGVYNDAYVVASYVIDCFEAGDEAELAVAFTTLEHCLQAADAEARGVFKLGILETIQCWSSNQSGGREAFEPWLLGKCRLASAELEANYCGEYAAAEALRLAGDSATAPGPDLGGIENEWLRDLVARVSPR
jgi:hypothetical protein